MRAATGFRRDDGIEMQAKQSTGCHIIPTPADYFFQLLNSVIPA
jgi:hypothetical protein